MRNAFLINIKLFASYTDESTHTRAPLVATMRRRPFGECFNTKKNTPNTYTHIRIQKYYNWVAKLS